MSQRNFTIKGTVNFADGQIAEGLIIKAYERYEGNETPVGKEGTTDEMGNYKIKYAATELKRQEKNKKRKPHLIVRAFCEGRQIAETEVEDLKVNPIIDLVVPIDRSQAESFVVKGLVLHKNGTPTKGVIIRAFDKDLRSEQPLGETRSDENGRYSIRYEIEQFLRAEKRCADLVVRVFGLKGREEKLLAKSPTIFNAKSEETIDLTVDDEYKGPSEYERIVTELEPLLLDITIEDIDNPTLIDKLADLNKEDIDFLAGDTEIDRSKIEFLALAAGHQKRAHDEKTQEKRFDLLTVAFYGIAREGLPIDLRALTLVRDQDLHATLMNAIEDDIVPRNFGEFINDFISSLHDLKSQLKFPTRISEVLKLETLSHLSPKELKEEDSELFLILRSMAISQLKSSLDSRFQNSSKALRDHIAGLDLAKAIDEGLNPGDILRDSLKSAGIRPEVVQEAQERLLELGEFGLPTSTLELDTPLRDQTLAHNLLQQGRVYALGGIVGLKEEKIEAVLDKSPTIFDLNDETFMSLVEGKKLEEEEAGKFGLAISIYNIVDGNIRLAEYLKKNSFSKLNNQPIRDASNLAAFDADDWESIIKKAEIKLPDVTTAKQYAAWICRRIESIYPGDVFLARIKSIDEGKIAEGLKKLKPLFERNESLFNGAGFDQLNKDGLKDADLERLRDEYIHLKRLANAYPALGIAELLDNKGLRSRDRAREGQIAREIARRISLLSTVQEKNADYELLALDYSPESADIRSLNLTYLSPDEQCMVLSSLKAYQRIYTITKDAKRAKAILESGYHSAFDIARDRPEKFLESTISIENPGIDYYEAARSRSVVTANQVASIWDSLKGGFDGLSVGNKGLDIGYYLKKMDGYADLFGSQDFCLCEHCQSIFSPAAYFVDLMYFLEKNVIDIYFAGDLNKHPLNLRERRPDLWRLQLTCENTNECIPTLDIINEILENYIAKHRGFSENDLNDKIAVQKEVYGEALALDGSANSFRLPFLLPLEILQIYLMHFNLTRPDVARLLDKDTSIVARAALKASTSEYGLIHNENTDVSFLKNLYDVDFHIALGTETIDDFDAKHLIKPMDLTREQLGDLIKTDFVRQGEDIQIEMEKKDEESVQNDVERVKNLTPSSLDRMHRFVRLWRHLPWSMKELDLVLSRLNSPSKIDKGAVDKLATVLYLQECLHLSVEEICACWSDLHLPPGSPEKRDSLFDRLFNLPPFMKLHGSLPKNEEFTHPSFEPESSAPEDNTLYRLRAGLNADDEQLYLLIVHLEKPLGLSLSPADPINKKVGFDLSVKNLTLLYRHILLARRLNLNLNLSIPDLFQLIEHAGIHDGHVKCLDDLSALIEFHDWWKTSGYELDDLGYITGGKVLKSSSYLKADDVVSRILKAVKEKRLLDFADTVFAFLESVTEEQSRSIIESNQNYFDLADEGKSIYCLSSVFGSGTTLIVPQGINIEGTSEEIQEKLRSILLKYHATEVIPNLLSPILNLTVGKTKALIAMTETNLYSSEFTSALQADPALNPQSLQSLKDLVGKILPLRVLFHKDIYDPTALEFIYKNASIFFINGFEQIDLQNIRKLSVYASLADTTQEERFSAKEPGFKPDDVLQALLALHNHTPAQLTGAEKELLAKVLRAEVGLMSTLLANVSLPGTAPEALQKLARCTELAKYLGVGGETINLIASETYDELSLASDAILGAFRAKYPDDMVWKEKIAPFDDKIRGLKRDALVEYLTSHVQPEFESSNDLYHYFLIDVALEGCATISRIVAAISSVQLYIQRVLMNLEQDDLPPSNKDHVHVLPECIPLGEWSWRKNYRVWEANRKVFLFPENYIEPELRADKTPLFDELESTLLQQEITEQNVLDAYASYMKGFEEVARLKIAGSYHDKSYVFNKETNSHELQKDILHLFGVNSGDPPVYYYRTVENAIKGALESEDDPGIIWSPWRKIDVQIPVTKVAPVVYGGRLYVFWVEIITNPKNSVKNGDSVFTGYKHKISLKYTTLKLDGTWTPPQKVSSRLTEFNTDDIIIDDDLVDLDLGLIKKIKHPKYNETKIHYYDEPIDGYTLEGFLWDQVYPNVIDNKIITMNLIGPLIVGDYSIVGEMDFYTNSLIASKSFNKIASWKYVLYLEEKDWGCGSSNYVLYCIPSIEGYFEYCNRSLILNNLDLVRKFFKPNSFNSLNPLATLEKVDEISIINGSPEDCIIDVHGDLLLLQRAPGLIFPDHVLKRLGTTLDEEIPRILSTDGIDALFDIKEQKSLKESSLPIKIQERLHSKLIEFDERKIGKIDFKGPYGVYYREIFFHIPFLIANHLNSQQKFAAAQRWYNYIFDPTAEEIPLPTPESDRNWRFIEFRGLGLPKFREILTDKNAIEVYRSNPFDPHAIARLRLSAYQKSIVMKYIDNLLDWGDSLFSQFTMESVNEATLLYAMAADILGERPAQLGDCGEGKIDPKNYEKIKPLMEKGSEFLAEVETLTAGESFLRLKRNKKPKGTYVDLDYHIGGYAASAGVMEPVGSAAPAMSAADAPENLQTAEVATTAGIFRGYDWKKTYTSSWRTQKAGALSRDSFTQMIDHGSPLIQDPGLVQDFGLSLLRQAAAMGPVFCFPMNKELLDYWGRVEDRLEKIRNCKDILGVKRELALFSPEIDPRLLVRAKAAGLSLEDVLNATSGNLPPYRFAYLIEKAKSYASTVQSFGSALLSALEKKDVEELNRLRTIHEQNIQKLTTRMKEWEIKAESETILSLEKEQESIQYRRDYYQKLIDLGLMSSERTEQGAIRASSILKGIAAGIDLAATISYLVPQAGSPFCLTFGGKQLGHSGETLSDALELAAKIADSIASSAGLEAKLQRREQEWKYNKQLAVNELSQVEKKIVAAKIRKDITQKSLEIHEKSIKQTEEIYDYYADKFSSLGLYTWLSSTLMRLYRDAYNSAFAMARLAEQAFRFERDEDAMFLTSNYWEASKSGLLAGESLLIDLENMERRFIETNYRNLEIEQSFSLEEINPAALISLREQGEAGFTIPEICFDLFYPGQYRRVIKAVRVTIPCVTGPYTNVSATLTLKESKIRNEPKVDASLIPVPLRRSMSIATSRAQNDSGVFEFSFRDERYMPFEGAGAVNSKWKLSLPKNFPQFDYQTISDVIIHISYTAEENESFRKEVEGATGALQSELSKHPFMRVFNLKHDFPGEFHQIVNSPEGTDVNIEIKDKHFPFLLQSFLKASKVSADKALLVLKVAKDQTINNLVISIDGKQKKEFEKLNLLNFDDLFFADIKAIFSQTVQGKDVIKLGKHVLKVEGAGDLSPGPAETSAIDPRKLIDIILYLEYKITAT